MKKSKILLICMAFTIMVCTLTVGVLVIKPSNNSVNGSVVLNSSPYHNLEVTGYINENTALQTTNVRAGLTWSNGLAALEFDTRNVYDMDDVKDIVLRIHIKNLGSQEIGAYFYNGEGKNQQIATGADIKVLDASNAHIKASLSGYKYIAPNDDTTINNTSNDEVDMYVTFSVNSIPSEPTTLNFAYYLNIEDYIPNNEFESGVGGNIQYVSSLPAGNSTTPGTTIADTLVKVPSTVTAIPAYAFSTNIKYVALPKATTISGYAFHESENLEQIHLPNVTTIEHDAFSWCVGLIEIDLTSVTTIGMSAFSFTNLTKVIYNKTLIDWLNVLIENDPSLFSQNTSFVVNGSELVGQLTIPDGITSIGSHFAEYTKLTSVNLNDVTQIGNYAFAGWTNLTEIDLSNVTTIGAQAFRGCVYLTEVTIGANVSSIGAHPFIYCGVTVILDSSAIASVYIENLLTLNGVTTLYLKSTISTSSIVTKITSYGLTKSAIQDKTGYVKYTR